MNVQAFLSIAISPESIAAASTIVLAAVGVLTFLANRRLYRETSGQNAANLEIAVEQTKTAKLQMAAINEQAEIARQALQLQVTPRLIPAGPELCRYGPSETLQPEPQPIVITPAFIDIVNAGNGVALIETDQAEAKSVREGASREMTIILPPALAPGAQATVKLVRPAMEDQAIATGDRFDVSIPYRADGVPDRLWRLQFSARYFNEGHWQLKVIQDTP